MTCLRPDPLRSDADPLKVLDEPLAGFALDLVLQFQNCFGWRFDQDSLQGLLLLALRHFPEPGCGSRRVEAPLPLEALIGRLQLAGDLIQGEDGLSLTPKGLQRLRSTFRSALGAAEWLQVRERIDEDLKLFSELDCLPMAMH